VENLLMFGAKAVERATAKYFLRVVSVESEGYGRPVDAPSRLPSLDRGHDERKNARAPLQLFSPGVELVPNLVQQFQESIGGRAYLIEVAPIAPGRWRAYLARVPGVPTALMPFYGQTADEAAGLLTDWLNRAHRRTGATSSG
jgi:hypothetical protein